MNMQESGKYTGKEGRPEGLLFSLKSRGSTRSGGWKTGSELVHKSIFTPLRQKETKS